MIIMIIATALIQWTTRTHDGWIALAGPDAKRPSPAEMLVMIRSTYSPASDGRGKPRKYSTTEPAIYYGIPRISPRTDATSPSQKSEPDRPVPPAPGAPFGGFPEISRDRLLRNDCLRCLVTLVLAIQHLSADRPRCPRRDDA
jgi:hypothetical protein